VFDFNSIPDRLNIALSTFLPAIGHFLVETLSYHDLIFGPEHLHNSNGHVARLCEKESVLNP